MKKPYIVCHMVQSVNGRIDCAMVDKISGDEYYDTLKTFKAPSYLNGRVTMEHYWAEKKKFQPKKDTPADKTSVFVAEDAHAYVFSCETRGSLMWKSNRVDNLPLVCIVGEQTTQEYLDYLKAKKISYICADKKSINLKKAMELVAREFAVKRLAVLGGGVINGAFMKDGLIDEYSILLAPGIDARKGRVASFDGLSDVKRNPVPLTLTGCKKLANGVVWLKYKPADKQ